ncbi:non-ribosomal peptide synthetase [Streptomyces purpurascens]
MVPSYLDVVLSALERVPRDLPDLRCVSVTGEALRGELVQRWFAGGPAVRLVNAYGLTETSDDTHHEVMDRAPAGDRIPIGRPIANVRQYVVDENLLPVPLGAPGAIVFSGVCVGRGYVNERGRGDRRGPARATTRTCSPRTWSRRPSTGWTACRSPPTARPTARRSRRSPRTSVRPGTPAALRGPRPNGGSRRSGPRNSACPGRIRRDDNFFDLGGTSLSAVRLAVSLDRVMSRATSPAAPYWPTWPG